MNMEDILKHAKNTQVKGHCIYKEATLFPISTKCLVVVFFFFFEQFVKEWNEIFLQMTQP